MLKRFVGIAAVLAAAVPFAVMAQEATPEPTMEMGMDMTMEATMEMGMDVELIELPEVDPLSVSGEIIAAGSSTVFPLAEVVAEAFTEEGFSGTITIDSIGSGAGFERFCVAGETDIATASRAINEEEIASCAALTPARTPIEFRVGTDAVTVVVSSENDFLEDITIEQLSQIYSGEATTWDQIDSSYPAETIQVFSPGSDSGTYDYFLESTLEADVEDGGRALESEDAGAAIAAVPGIQFSEDDNVLVQGVEGSPYAIGYFGFAFYDENQDVLNAVSVEGIEPNAESAESGDYPLSRPLYIYSDAGVIAEKPQVGAFINFFLANVNDLIVEAGYFPASNTALNEARQALIDSMGM